MNVAVAAGSVHAPVSVRHPAVLLGIAVLVTAVCASVAAQEATRDTPEPLAAGHVPDAELGRGRASWYGPKFHGRRTSSGERFDMNGLTAAHPTLPFGTRVRVRNEANGREVVVRINDRLPGVRGRIIDLSKAAGAALGIVKAGHAPVLLIEHRAD